MDYTKELYDLCETLSEALKEANEKIRQAGGKLTGDDVAYVDKLTHAMKSIKAVIAMMEDEGYSGDDDSYRGGRSYGRSYAMRDSRGRYSRRYSGEVYSRHGDIAEQLRDLMQDAPDEKTRMEIKRLADRL